MITVLANVPTPHGPRPSADTVITGVYIATSFTRPLTNRGRVTYICASTLGHHWFKRWFVACSASLVNNCQWILDLITTIFKDLLSFYAGWRHQMETFSALLALCEGNPSVTGGFPSQRPVTRSFDVFFCARLNKRLSKQSRCWWFETPRRSLWRHCNGHCELSFCKYRWHIRFC